MDLPLDPMHGTVGVAPALGEVRSALTPGPRGGDMDTPEMRAGTTCYLRGQRRGSVVGHRRRPCPSGGGRVAWLLAVATAMDSVVALELLKATGRALSPAGG